MEIVLETANTSPLKRRLRQKKVSKLQSKYTIKEKNNHMRRISSTKLENKKVSVQAKLKIDLSKLRH